MDVEDPVTLAVARQSVDAGTYRSAYSGVLQVLKRRPKHAPALALKREILEKAVVKTAVLPLVKGGVAGLPSGYLDELNEKLAFEHWIKPPVFVFVAKPQDIRSAIRKLELADKVASDSQAAALGGLKVKLVAVEEGQKYALREADVKTRSIQVKDKAGALKSLQERSGRAILEVEVGYGIIDAATGQEIGSGTVNSVQDRSFRRASCSGAVRELLLTRDQRKLLNAESAQAAAKVLDGETIEDIKVKVAEAYFAFFQEQIP